MVRKSADKQMTFGYGLIAARLNCAKELGRSRSLGDRLFRGLFLEKLAIPHAEGCLRFLGDLAHLTAPQAFGA